MIYIVFIFVALLSVATVCFAGARKGVIYLGEKSNIYKPGDDEILPYKGKKLTLIILVCFAVALAIQISLYKNTTVLNFVKLYGLWVIVFSAALIDAKRKIIPNVLIICGVLFRVVIIIVELVMKVELKPVLLNELVGFAIGFGFLAAISIITKGSLGFGDAKLFGVIGLLSGSFCTYSTLLVSLIVSASFSLVKLLRKKMKRTDSIPFGPSIAVGYIIAILLTSY